MRFEGREVGIRDVLKNAWSDIMNNHTMAMAAGLSYYFVLSLFPLLILAASLLALLPIPHLFDYLVAVIVRNMPPDTMGLMFRVLHTVVQPRAGLFTVGLIGTLWTVSGGFSSLIEALNVAYDVPETRPMWKTRLLALGLAFVIGGIMLAGIAVTVLGPKIGQWITHWIGLSSQFMQVWPYIRWTLSVVLNVLAVEMLFFWAPNVKQRFWATLPGAFFGVGFWIGSSYALSLYFRHFANYNKTYGVLGGAIMLLTWMYWSWFAILVGAEINSELVKAGGGGRLELKGKPPAAVKPRPAWEEKPAA